MTRLPTDALAAFGGLAWADAQHAVCLPAAGAAPRAFRVRGHTPEAIDAWVSTVRQRCKGPPLARCLARTTGPLGSALRQDDGLGLVPVTPLLLASARAACAPSPAKDDPTAAELPLERRLNHRDTRTPLNPQRPALRPLAPRVDHRRRLVGDNGRLTTRRRRTLHNDFPPVLPWVHDTDTALFGAFLTPWPTLQAAQLARRTPLERCVQTHHGRSADVIAQRLHALKRAMPLTADEGVSGANALLLQALVSQRRVTWHAIATVDQTLAPHAQPHPAVP
jgi:hypothetical protein